MNKEEILNTFLLANIPEIITQEEFDDVKKAIFEMLKENKQLKENYERIYNENCILREKHNINDICLLEENYKLKQVIDKAIDKLEEVKERRIMLLDEEKVLDILKEEE